MAEFLRFVFFSSSQERPICGADPVSHRSPRLSLDSCKAVARAWMGNVSSITMASGVDCTRAHPMAPGFFSRQRGWHLMPGRDPTAFSPTLSTTGWAFAGVSPPPRELRSGSFTRVPVPIDPLKLFKLLRSCLPQLEKNPCPHPFLGIDSWAVEGAQSSV